MARSRQSAMTEALALQDARGGRSANVARALMCCRRVLRSRNGNTNTAWSGLDLRARQLEARLNRMSNTTTRRHHPVNPVRPPHPPRFILEG